MAEPRSITAGRDTAPATLQDFMAAWLGLSRNRAKKLIDDRRVFVNNRRVWMARHRIKPGDRIELQPEPQAATAALLQILYRDESVAVIDKPAGLISNGEDSVETLLQHEASCRTFRMVHRLDRDTTGCLVAAANQQLFDRMVEFFRDQQVEKTYEALVAGRVTRARGVLCQPIDDKPAETHYEVLRAGEQASLLRLRLVTGRTHQVRRHLAGIGHPLLGDRSYSTEKQVDPRLRSVPRQMLHAARIRFPHPVTEEAVEARSPRPRDFQHMLRKLLPPG